MVLCIIPPKFRLIPETLKELELWALFGTGRQRPDRQMDRQTAGSNDRRQYPSEPMMAEGKSCNQNSIYPLQGINIISKFQSQQHFTKAKYNRARSYIAFLFRDTHIHFLKFSFAIGIKHQYVWYICQDHLCFTWVSLILMFFFPEIKTSDIQSHNNEAMPLSVMMLFGMDLTWTLLICYCLSLNLLPAAQ